MSKSSIFFFVIGLGALAATGAILGIGPGTMLVPASLAGTWILAAALLLASFGPSGLARAYRAAASGGTRAELGEAVAFFSSARRLLIAASAFCSILAVVEALSKIDTLEHLGFPLAIALCSMLYSALGIIFLVEPFRAAAEKRLAGL